MYNIFDVEHSTYNRSLANTLVLKIKALKSIVQKSEIEKRQIESEIVSRKRRKEKALRFRAKKNHEDLEVIYSDISAEIAKEIEVEIKSISYDIEIRIRMANANLQTLKLELFNLMAKVVVKNINNYMSLAFNSPVTEECNDRDEMQAEAWIILDNCVDKFKVNKKYCFYFYFNKALGRNFYRMFFRTVQNLEKYRNYSSEYKHTKTKLTYGNSNFGMDILIDSLYLTEDEEKVLRSKLIREKKSDFLSKNPDMSSGKYYGALKKIKNEVIKFKENGEL